MKCLFCEFVSGKRKKHVNGYPFKSLHETKHALTFLSVDFPATEDGHTIVIPKKHFEQLETIPKNILADLMLEVKLVSKILRKNNEGTNILVNNGKCAGQKVMHAHFQIIPRNPKDDITIEDFERKQLSLPKFMGLYNGLKREF